ncbi:MAG: ribonuclease H family protein [Lachnospiraceae bacterium]|nr:ribonuclease H family protein [Lachnospiraceae bacterium]
MGKKVAYVVLKGRKPGIYKTWSDCQAQVKGFSGAVFKGYESMAEAEEAFRNGASGSTSSENKGSVSTQDLSTKNMPSDLDALYFTDGSFTTSGGYSFAVYEIIKDGLKSVFYKGFPSSNEEAKYRNVAGEVLGSTFAMQRAKDQGFKKIELRYDYEGVEHWCTGAWQAKNTMTQKYRDFYNSEIKPFIEVVFTHVPGHTSVDGNELCDKYAGLKTSKYTKADLAQFEAMVDCEVEM